MSRNFVAIDFETANYGNDSACSVGVVRVRDGQIAQQEMRMIRPPSNWFIFTHIHGIAWKDVAQAQTFGEVWPELAPLFEGADFIAAHNAGFDRRILLACCDRYQLEPPTQPFLCSMQLARSVWNLHPTKLSDVCQHLNIELNHHEALSDALACARILIAGESGFAEGPPLMPPPKALTRKLSAKVAKKTKPEQLPLLKNSLQ